MLQRALRTGFSFLIAGGAALWAQQYTISTVAGVPSTPQSIPARSTGIGAPARLVVDSAGNMYFSVAANNTRLIYRVDASGFLSHVVTGALSPVDIAITADTKGNLYLADTGNHRVRKVSAGGVITTIAGNGWQGFSGDGGPATGARLSYPRGVAVDSAANVYIADTRNNRIRKVSPEGIITTVVGGPDPSDLNNPVGVAVDASGNLYIYEEFLADVPASASILAHSRIRKVSPAGIITIFDNVPRSYGVAIALDADGNVYVPETACIAKISPNGIRATVAGRACDRILEEVGYSGDGGRATDARLDHPKAVAVDPYGNLYIADTLNNRVRKVSAFGIITTIAGNGSPNWWTDWAGYSGDGGPATSATMSFPSAVALDGSGNLYIADSANHRIRKVSLDGLIATVAGNGVGSYSGDGGLAIYAGLNWPSGVAVDGAGNLYISDSANNRIRKVSPDGFITTSRFSSNFSPNPGGLALDASGQLFAAGADNGAAVDAWARVYYSEGGKSIVIRGTQFSRGWSNTVIAGNEKPGYAGDGGPANSAQLRYPWGLAVDAAGNLYIADYADNRVRKVSPDGIITTIAGNGTPGYSGDGGPATDAQLYGPTGLAVDADGNVYVADASNGVIRKLQPRKPPPGPPMLPGDETVAFATFNPRDLTALGIETVGGGAANVGGGAANGDAGTMKGVLVMPTARMELSHVEVVVTRHGGGDTLNGYLMTDDIGPDGTNNGPGTVIEAFSFALPYSLRPLTPPVAFTPPTLVSASSTSHPVLKANQRYWFVLGAPDPVNDRFWWWATQASFVSTIAERKGNSGPWEVLDVALNYAPMLALYGVQERVSMEAPTITGISSAASGAPGIAAGSFVSIYGSNFAPVPFDDWSRAITNGRLPTQLRGVSVIMGGKAAYVAAVTPGQINVQAPDIQSGTAQVTVTAPGGTSAPFAATVPYFGAPAFFVWPGNQPVATHPDYSLAARDGTFSTPTVPAKPGEVITLWGTGFGLTDPPVPAGQVPTVQAPAVKSPVWVALGDVPVPVMSAVLSSYPGLYQIAIQIPASTADGNYPVIAALGAFGGSTIRSPSTVLLTVHR